jgi:DNA polymerase elongation subunit (family B)
MKKDDIKFQVLDWSYYHDENDEGQKEYKIRLFGRTSDNKTIYTKTNKFAPHFFAKVDKSWRQSQVKMLIDEAKKRVWPPENKEGLLGDPVPVEKYDFKGFSNFTKYNFLKLTFISYDAMRSYATVLKKGVFCPMISKKKIKLALYESNIEPFLRCMHMKDLDAVGWIKIDGDKYEHLDKSVTCCDINIETDWTNLTKVDDRSIQKFVIASFDIECMSIDGSFPQATRDGDKIIQIGTTFSRFGEEECFFQHIITLGSCDPIDGVTVEECPDEKSLLLAWTKLIRKMNPDIITGYNIFGFDFEYMMDRSQKLGIYHKFSQLSRVSNEQSKWERKKLASAALGDNTLKYFDMTGRVLIDMMKVAQRDHKLDSYKLDYVASYFIKEEINTFKRNTKSNKTVIITKNNQGVKIGQYVTIYYNDSITDNKHMDGKKFQIHELGETVIDNDGKKEILSTIIVSGLIDDDILSNKGFKIFWCQAKDDISPNDIFRLQKGTSKDRALVAKYCVQDAALCNKLISKLQVLVNNIGMANVCHVPLSYLFMRGQGVKIFSLVAKKCREMNHLIPVLDVKRSGEILNIKKDDKLKITTISVPYTRDIEKGQFIALYYDADVIKDKKKLKIMDMKSNEIVSDDGTIVKTLDVTLTGIFDVKQPTKETKLLWTQTKDKLGIDKVVDQLNNKDLGKDDDDDDDDDGYEGATVFDPERGAHFKPIPVLDFASLYPNAMILRNLSHEMFVNDKKYLNLPGYRYHEIIYNGNDGSQTKCIFAEKIDGTKGIIPKILIDLLSARKKFKREMEDEKDPFKKAILDGLQQAYKVTANSLYGQTGSTFSPIYLKEIAASTTATGREMLQFSRYFIEKIFSQIINTGLHNKAQYVKYMNEIYKYYPTKFKDNINGGDIEFHVCTDEKMEIAESKFNNEKLGYKNKKEFIDVTYKTIQTLLDKKYSIKPKVIYGDTDSVFFSANITDNETGEVLRDKTALSICINLGIWASILICAMLPPPMAQEYEKVLYPFLLLSKKRYVGNLYEKNPNKYKQKSMGIVLKRRDNAPIVKVVCGGIVDQILNKHSSEGAVNFTRASLKQILSEKFPIDKFIITKTLKNDYKNRTSIVHAVLADRMAKRDPGNKPQSNDRIPYVYVQTKGKVELQGERVEHPVYVLENNIKLDYLFYITNQIMKPSLQFLELIVEKPEIIFDEYIIRETNRRKGMMPIDYIFNTQLNQDSEHDDDYMVEDDDLDEHEIDKYEGDYGDQNFICEKIDFDNLDEELVKQRTPTKKKSIRKFKKKVTANEPQVFNELANGFEINL